MHGEKWGDGSHRAPSSSQTGRTLRGGKTELIKNHSSKKKTKKPNKP
jgi:hypothetical protein